MRSAIIGVAIAVGGWLNVAPTAQAATIGGGGGTAAGRAVPLLVVAAAGEANHIEVLGGAPGHVIIRETGTAPLVATAPSCAVVAADAKTFDCTLIFQAPAPPIVGVTLGDGDDSFKGVSQPLPARVDAGEGNDTLISGQGWQELLDGGPGFDTVDYSDHTTPVTVSLDGTANDGGAEDAAPENAVAIERVVGGAGNDLFLGNPGANAFEGRGGVDFVTYGERTAAQPVRVTADGVPDDGAAGEGDNVGADVEHIVGGAGNDTLGGSAATNVLDGGPGIDTATYAGRPQNVVADLDDVADDGAPGEQDRLIAFESLTGGNGSDVLTGSATANRLDGGPGGDLLDAGDGADTLVGGDGDDRLTGGADVDAYAAGAGDDAVTAFDGRAEEVDCGAGGDSAAVDAADRLTACEAVRRVDEILDVDRDGSLPPQDCNDRNAAIRPGARDVPANGVDEDCSGADARRGTVAASLSFLWAFTDTYAKARRFTLKNVPAGAVVRLSCTPPKGRRRACPFRTLRRASSGGAERIRLRSAFKRRRLPVGTRIEARVTRTELIGRVFRFTVRKGRIPSRRTLCLPPGAKNPRKC